MRRPRHRPSPLPQTAQGSALGAAAGSSLQPAGSRRQPCSLTSALCSPSCPISSQDTSPLCPAPLGTAGGRQGGGWPAAGCVCVVGRRDGWQQGETAGRAAPAAALGGQPGAAGAPRLNPFPGTALVAICVPKASSMAGRLAGRGTANEAQRTRSRERRVAAAPVVSSRAPGGARANAAWTPARPGAATPGGEAGSEE